MKATGPATDQLPHPTLRQRLTAAWDAFRRPNHTLDFYLHGIHASTAHTRQAGAR